MTTQKRIHARPGAPALQSANPTLRGVLAAPLALLAFAILAPASGCGPGIDRAATFDSLRTAMQAELPPGETDRLEEHNRLVEDAREGAIFLDMRRSEVQQELGRGQECGPRELCSRNGFEPDDWVYEIGRRDGSPWGPTLIVGFDRQGIATHVYSLTRR